MTFNTAVKFCNAFDKKAISQLTTPLRIVVEDIQPSSKFNGKALKPCRLFDSNYSDVTQTEST